MGCDSRLHSSNLNQCPATQQATTGERNTEFTNKECVRSIRCPFPVGNVVMAIDIEPKLLCALHDVSLGDVVITKDNYSAELL
jgi:hypothetical protein